MINPSNHSILFLLTFSVFNDVALVTQHYTLARRICNAICSYCIRIVNNVLRNHYTNTWNISCIWKRKFMQYNTVIYEIFLSNQLSFDLKNRSFSPIFHFIEKFRYRFFFDVAFIMNTKKEKAMIIYIGIFCLKNKNKLCLYSAPY